MDIVFSGESPVRLHEAAKEGKSARSTFLYQRRRSMDMVGNG